MKRLIFLAVIACLAVGTTFAQQGGERGRGQGRGGVQNIPPRTTVAGTLLLQNGMIALASGENTYFVPSLMRFAGFIEGIREGAHVSMDGFVFGNRFLPAAITVGGRTHDLIPGDMHGGRRGPGRFHGQACHCRRGRGR